MSTSITPTTTNIPSWPTSFEPTKSPFIIYNRADGETDIRYSPNIVNIGTTIPDAGEYDRDAIVFDVANRTVLRHKKGSKDDLILSGHAYYGGAHNEIFNDYKQNSALPACSYSFVGGIGNSVKYNTSFSSSGGTAFGHYNSSATSYLFTVGNGLNDKNRSNILTLTDESVVFGYSPQVENGKYVTITNGNVTVDGDLTVSGTINGESSGGGASSEELEKLKKRVDEDENTISMLNDTVGMLKGEINALQSQVKSLNTTVEALTTSLADILGNLDLEAEN